MTLVGGLNGVIEFDADEAIEVPFALTAAIVKVYAVPAIKDPVTLSGLVKLDVEREIDGLDVTVYAVIVDPPVPPAVNGIETVVVFTVETVPIVGACGRVVIAIELDEEDSAESPIEFTAYALT